MRRERERKRKREREGWACVSTNDRQETPRCVAFGGVVVDVVVCGCINGVVSEACV